MNKRRWGALTFSALILILLASCGKKEPDKASSSPPAEEPAISAVAPVEPKPEPEPVYPYINPLTAEGLYEDIQGKRPVAVMFNNLKKALPQLGVSQADVIYEIVAEGGITRMMGVFQDLEGAGDLGSVRSARDYYASIALGHDAIYIHAGGSPQAYDAFDNWGITHIDFVNGPYGNMCWRDQARRKTAGLEHSLLTSSEKVLEQMPSRFRLEHEEGFRVPWAFAGEPAYIGQPASKVTVPFSKYKTGYFSYDADKKQYFISQSLDGSDPIDYVDGNTSEAVGVSNVLVLFTDIGMVKGDDKGRRSVRTTGTGDGLLFRDGTLQKITWKRDKRTDCFRFLDEAGLDAVLAFGPSYINIVDASTQVTWEGASSGEAQPE